MIIHRLHLMNVKGVVNREIEFADSGITLVVGDNEVGKTTLIDAFQFLMTQKFNTRSAQQRALVPIGRDEAPTVEAELTLGKHRILVRKVFGGGKGKAELEYLAGPGVGKKLTGGEASDAIDQLWQGSDRELWTALNELSKTRFGQQSLSGSSALRDALQNATGGIAVGEDERPLVELSFEHKKQFYTATDRPTGVLKQAMDTAEQAEQAFSLANTEMVEVETIIDRLTRANEKLLNDEQLLQSARQNCEQAKAAVAEVADAVADEQQASQAVAQLSSEAKAAKQAYQSRVDLIETMDELEESWQETKTLVEKLADELEPLKLAETEAAELTEAATKQLAEANKTLDHSRLLRDQVLAQAEVNRLEQLLTKVTETKQKISLLAAQAESMMTKQLAAEVEKSQQKIDSAKATLEASSASVTATALSDAAELVVDGEKISADRLAAGLWEQPLVDETSLVIPGLWQIDFSPGSAGDAKQLVRQAEEELADLLSKIGFETADQALAEWLRAEQISHDLQRAKDQLEIQLGDSSFEEMTDALSYARAKLHDDSPSQTSLDEIEQRILEDGEAVTAWQLTADQAKQELDLARQAQQAKTIEVEKARVKQVEIAAQFERAREKLGNARKLALDDDLETKLADTEKALALATEQLEKAQQVLISLDAATKQEQLDNLIHEVETRSQKVKSELAQKNELAGQLKGMSADSRKSALDEAQTRLENAKLKLAQVSLRAEAAKLLYETLSSYLSQMEERYQAPFTEQINRLGRLVYRDDNFQVRLAQDLTVKSRVLDGTDIPYESLSAGAKEQLLILVKLAAAMLVNPADGVPVLMDDLLGHTDPSRQNRMAKALELASEKTQIIILTADEVRYSGVLSNAKVVRLS